MDPETHVLKFGLKNTKLKQKQNSGKQCIYVYWFFIQDMIKDTDEHPRGRGA